MYNGSSYFVICGSFRSIFHIDSEYWCYFFDLVSVSCDTKFMRILWNDSSFINTNSELSQQMMARIFKRILDMLQSKKFCND